MGRKRTNRDHAGLPPRWAKRSSTYYYRPAPGERHRWDNKHWFRLGKTLGEAHREFAKHADLATDVATMNKLCDRYVREVLPEKAATTRKQQSYSLERIRKVFGETAVDAIEPQHCYQYRDWCAKQKSKTWANRDLEVLSHLFSKANEWGARAGHPMTGKQVTKFSLKARDRYVSDAELAEFREHFAGPFLDAYLKLKGLTGLRKGDMLSIKLSDFQGGYLRVKPRKTQGHGGPPLLFEMNDNMRVAVAAIKALPRPVQSVWLFCTREGQPYINLEEGRDEGTTSGFDSIWQRRMVKFAKAGNERFTEHDLRAKVGSDIVDETEAQNTLHHGSLGTTRKHYRRKGKVITPARGFGAK